MPLTCSEHQSNFCDTLKNSKENITAISKIGSESIQLVFSKNKLHLAPLLLTQHVCYRSAVIIQKKNSTYFPAINEILALMIPL